MTNADNKQSQKRYVVRCDYCGIRDGQYIWLGAAEASCRMHEHINADRDSGSHICHVESVSVEVA